MCGFKIFNCASNLPAIPPGKQNEISIITAPLDSCKSTFLQVEELELHVTKCTLRGDIMLKYLPSRCGPHVCCSFHKVLWTKNRESFSMLNANAYPMHPVQDIEKQAPLRHF